MLISVISPHTSKNGNTMTSILLGLGLASTQKKTLLFGIKPNCRSFIQYFGLKSYIDKTSTSSQLVKLMSAGAIKVEEIVDYCKGVYDNFYVFADVQGTLSEDDMTVMLGFMPTIGSVYDYVIVDVNCDSENADEVISNSNIVVINLSLDAGDFDRFNKNKSRIMKACRGKKVILVCNKYIDSVSVKEIAKILDVKTELITIHLNKWLAYGCYKSDIVDVFKKSRIKDSRLIDVSTDINSLVKAVQKARLAALKKAKGGGNK